MRKSLFRKKEEGPIIKPPCLDSFPDFTKKEIFTQGELINDLLDRYIRADKISFDYLKIKADRIKRIYIVAGGVDYALTAFAAYNFEVLVDTVSVPVSKGEFLCSNPILDKGTLVVLVGDDKAVETRTSENGARLVKIVNYSDEKQVIRLDYKTLGSFSTAEFTLKLTALCLLALYLGEKKQVVTALYIRIATKMLGGLSDKIRRILSQEFIINELSGVLDFDNILLTGTNVDYSICTYAAYIFSNVMKKDIPCAPFGELSAYQKTEKRLLALASNIDFYNLLDNRLSYQLKIIAGSVDVLDEKTILYEETIPLLNPILSAVVIQLLAYKKSVAESSFL